jgi:hypothetical protein
MGNAHKHDIPTPTPTPKSSSKQVCCFELKLNGETNAFPLSTFGNKSIKQVACGQHFTLYLTSE